MSQPNFLDHRAIVSVSGADAEAFLNGIVTVSSSGIAPDALRYGALLTPQGKVIADFLLSHADGAVLIDCAAVAAPVLAKRLTLMKLRAHVAIEERFDLGVFAFDGAADPRAATAPRRRIGPRGEPGPLDVYHAARIKAGLAEQGFDFGAEEVFPADINMDLLSGVDFKKGCFVGQEVVSRMKRRGTTRRRTLRIVVPQGVGTPSPILANAFEIGMLTSVSGGAGLARVRIDRLADAQAAGETITVDGKTASFEPTAWLAGEMAALAEAKQAKA